MASDFNININTIIPTPDLVSIPTLEKVSLEVASQNLPPPTISSQGKFLALGGNSILVPKKMYVPWGGFNFRNSTVGAFKSGVEAREACVDITRLDPNSLEFESSINWLSENFVSSNTLQDYYSLKKFYGRDACTLVPESLNVTSSNDISNLAKTIFSKVNSGIDSYCLIETNSLCYIENSQKEVFQLLGRTEVRPEIHWLVRGRVKEDELTIFINSILLISKLSDSVVKTKDMSLPSYGYDSYHRYKAKCLHDNIQNNTLVPKNAETKAGLILENTKIRLINVYESVDSVSHNVCLSFLVNSGSTEDIKYSISHFWYSIPHGTQVETGYIILGEDTRIPYKFVAAGIPHAMYSMYLYTLGMDPIRNIYEIIVNDTKFSIPIRNILYYVLESALVLRGISELGIEGSMYLSTIPVAPKAVRNASALNISSKNFVPDSFGLKISSTGFLISDPGSDFSKRVLEIKVLSNIIEKTKNIYKPPSNRTLNINELRNLFKESLTNLDFSEIVRSNYITALLDSKIETLKAKKVKDYKSFTKALAEPEFRGNLPF